MLGAPYRYFAENRLQCAPAIGERLISKGKVLKPGKRQIVVRSEVFSEMGDGAMKLVAAATATIIPTGSPGA